MVRPLPPYSSGISTREEAGLGQRRRRTRSDRRARGRACASTRRETARTARAPPRGSARGRRLAHAVTSARPLFIATTLRSGTSARKLDHVAVAPHLGADGLARKHRRREPAGERFHAAGIVVAHALAAARGRPRRRCRARAGSAADSRRPWRRRDRRAADCGRRSADRSSPPPAGSSDRRTRSGARSGSLCSGGASRGGPPKPPSARQNVVCVTVAISSPLALSVTLRSV